MTTISYPEPLNDGSGYEIATIKEEAIVFITRWGTCAPDEYRFRHPWSQNRILMSCLISPPIIHKAPANFTQIIHKLEVTIARKVLPHPQGIRQTENFFPDNNILKLSPPSPPPVDNFFGEKIFPDNNITIAFVTFFPILVALFPILQHQDSDNIDNFPTGLNNRGGGGGGGDDLDVFK
jgi:hypothetical protein